VREIQWQFGYHRQHILNVLLLTIKQLLGQWLSNFLKQCMTRGRWIICTLLLTLFLAVNSGEASEPRGDIQPALTNLSIEELMEIEVATVYGASKYEQKVTEAPSSVTIVTDDDIKKYGYRTLADILRSVRGFYTTYDRNYHYIGVRGFSRPGDYNTRVLLLVNGVRINDNIYEQASIGTDFPVDVDLIKRVEVIRGPGSSLYGSNAFFGVVNVITKLGQDFKGVETSGEAGSFNTYKGRFSYGNQFQNGLEMALSISYYDSKGDDRLYYKEFDNPATNNGVAEDLDYDRYKSLFGKFSFHDFTLQGAYVHREKGVPTASFETVFNDSHSFTVDEHFHIDLKYEHNFADDISVMARLNYNYYGYHGDYPYDDANPGDPPYIIVTKDYSKGKWWGGELQITKKLFEKHKFVIGGEYRDNFQQDQGTYDKIEVYLNDKRDSIIWAFYIQDEYRILNNLILNAGLRYDNYETFGSTTNPRLALIYNPFEKTTFKLLYGKAFRAPSAYELYYQASGSGGQKLNPDLKAETINTYELIYEQFIGKYLRGTVTAFYYKIDDLITITTDPSDNLLIYENIDKVEAKGVEFELEGKWESGLNGKISYTFQETTDKKTGEILTNSPRHLAKLNLIVPVIKKKLFVGMEEQYTSKKKTLTGKNMDDFFISSLTLFSQNLLKNLEASATVYNLFNKKYGDPGSEEHVQDIIEQDGRGFRFKLTYKF
jgi:outer membrane receptor for ferrienterochelin and colicins